MDEVDFPRGGAPTLTPLEVRKIRTTAEKDLLFEKKTVEPVKKKKKVLKISNNEKNVSEVLKPKERFVDNFSFKYLVPELLILGYVSKINVSEIIIGLPNGISGYLDCNDLQLTLNGLGNDNGDDKSDEEDDSNALVSVSEMFTVGQLVPVVIKTLFPDLKSFKRILLSALPSDINSQLMQKMVKKNMLLWGMITSIEDHGCLVSFGKKAFTGFLPKTDFEKSESMKIGSIHWMVVTKTSKKVFIVTLKELQTSKIHDESTHFNALIPGQMVSISVTKVFDGGVMGKIFDSFDTVIENLHLADREEPPENLLETSVKGRIIHTNPKVKQIGVSLLPELVNFSSDLTKCNTGYGDIFENCEVIDTIKNFKLIMRLPDGRFGIIRRSNLSDEVVEKFGKKYAIGTKHKCRIIGHQTLEKICLLSMKKSDLEREIFRREDLKPGLLLEGHVIRLESYGALIRISEQFKGLCPTKHLADIVLKRPEMKYYPDNKVMCRVLQNNTETKKVTLTCKKSLVKNEGPIITSYDEACVGQVVKGFVSGLQPYGVFVSFYNDVVALLPKSEILAPSGTTMDAMFPVGKVIQCAIISVDASKKRINVSTKFLDADSLVKKKLQSKRKIGDVISAKFLQIENDIVKVRTKDCEEFSMRKNHLSDFSSLNDEWTAFLKVSSDQTKFRTLRVTSIDAVKHSTYVSQKHICQEMKQLTFDDLSVGATYGGVITHIMEFGVFVEISPGLQGLAITKLLSDEYVKDISEWYKVGQSVVAKVADINEEKRRFILSLKVSEVISDVDESTDEFCSYQGKELLELYFLQRGKLLKAINNSSDDKMKLLLSIDKEVVITKVTSVTAEGVMLSYEADDIRVEGLIPKASKFGVEFIVGGTCQCLVVFVDIANRSFVGYADETSILGFLNGRKLKKSPKFEDGISIDCTVCYANNDVIVALMPKQYYNIVYLPVKKHLNARVVHMAPINRKIMAQYGSESKYGTILTKLFNSDEEAIADGRSLAVGSIVDVTVKSIKHQQLTVTLSDRRFPARVFISEMSDDTEEGQTPMKGFKVGEVLKAKVVAFRNFKTHRYLPVSHQSLRNSLAELSLKQSELGSEVVQFKPREAKDFKIGEEINCFIESHASHGVKVVVNSDLRAFIPYLLLSTNIQDLKRPKKVYHQGNMYKAVVCAFDEKKEQISLSRIGDPAELLKKNSIVIGRIVKTVKNGVLIGLPNNKLGIAHPTEISDTFTDNPLDEFNGESDMFVRCKVLAVNTKINQIDLSLRASRLTDTVLEDGSFDRCIDGYDDLNGGDILRGFVKSITRVGVFVSLATGIVGRVQIKNLSRYFVKDIEKVFSVGKVVKAKILSIDPLSNQIDLSLRGTDVNDEDPVAPPKRKTSDCENEARDNDEASPQKKRKIHEADASDANESDDENDETIDSAEESDDESAEEVLKDALVSDDEDEDEEDKEKPSLELGKSFDWGADDQHENDVRSSASDDDSDEENSEKSSSKKSKRQKRAAKKAEEEYLHKAELALLDTERDLESAEDFDRLVLGSPNSSIVWIQYMAFHLHAAEVEKAIAVGRRALKTISFREEQEKLNVWVALLNLENSYGTKDSLEKVFQEAIKVNEPKKIFFKMVDIYAKNDKKEEADKLYHVMMKRFKTSKRVWCDYGWFLMSCSRVEEARKLLQRSMKSLPERKHIATIVKFGMMEYKMGDSQRGATIFESLLKNYPKRTDLWSIYIDMCIKEGDTEQVRNIFERVTTLNVGVKKMKFLFKRYVLFEQQYGSVATLAAAQRKAEEYLDQQMFAGMQE